MTAAARIPSRPDPAPALAELRRLLGDRLSTAAAVREQHGKDLTYHEGHPPDAVAFANSTGEVAAIVRVCAAQARRSFPSGRAPRSKATSPRWRAGSASTSRA